MSSWRRDHSQENARLIINQTNNHWFCHETKRFMKIYTRSLMKSLGHQTRLETINEPIMFAFNSVHPLSYNKILRIIWWNQIPRTIVKKIIKIIKHGWPPTRILKRLSVRGRFDITTRDDNHKTILGIRFIDVIFGSSEHVDIDGFVNASGWWRVGLGRVTVGVWVSDYENGGIGIQ